MNAGYNPDFNPTGIEGGVDTNDIPWMTLPQAPGMAIKPLRASSESGMFSAVIQVKGGTELKNLVYLGAMDMLVLSGTLNYPSGPMAGALDPGTWGYIPANAKVDRFIAMPAAVADSYSFLDSSNPLFQMRQSFPFVGSTALTFCFIFPL